MSEEQLKAFLEKVKSDTSLQEELKGAADVDAVIDIAKEAGFSISAEEINAAQSSPQELSDEDLEGVSGGYGSDVCPKLINVMKLTIHCDQSAGI